MTEADRIYIFEKEVNSRFHEHGKHISRIEGIMEERTLNLKEMNETLRNDLVIVSDKIERVEERLTTKIDTLTTTVRLLSESVLRQGVYIGFAAMVGAAIVSALIKRFI